MSEQREHELGHTRSEMIAYHTHSIDSALWNGEKGCQLPDCPVCVGGERTLAAAGRARAMMISNDYRKLMGA